MELRSAIHDPATTSSANMHYLILAVEHLDLRAACMLARLHVSAAMDVVLLISDLHKQALEHTEH